MTHAVMLVNTATRSDVSHVDLVFTVFSFFPLKPYEDCNTWPLLLAIRKRSVILVIGWVTVSQVHVDFLSGEHNNSEHRNMACHAQMLRGNDARCRRDF